MTYHALQAELESANIVHEGYDSLLYLRLLLDKALLNRNAAIHELSKHEQTHLRTKSTVA